MVDTFLLAKSFVTLLVITDPVGTVPIFLAITAEWGTRDRNRAAWQAVVVAALVIATFARPEPADRGGAAAAGDRAGPTARRDREHVGGDQVQRRLRPARHAAAGRARRDRGHHGVHAPGRARRPAPRGRPRAAGRAGRAVPVPAVRRPAPAAPAPGRHRPDHPHLRAAAGRDRGPARGRRRPGARSRRPLTGK